MIRKLRIKLIAASMLSLFLVLAIIICSITVLNYRKIIRDADQILSLLSANDGTFPKTSARNPMDTPRSRPHADQLMLSPELPYESRYFSVFLGPNGEVISVDTGKIAAVDTSEAIQYSLHVLESGKEHGFIDDYRYCAVDSDTGMHMIFLDCGRSLNTFRAFVFTSTLVSAAGLSAVLLLLIFTSGRIVKPFAETYEKQKRFITDAGHELKTPLTIIHADTELLEMDLGENQWLSDIQNQTSRLAELTNNLILLSRLEEEQPRSQSVEFSISDAAEETAETFRSLAVSRRKHLNSDIQPLVSMTGDEKAIRQLISILLDNAVKYSPDGGRISITLKKQKNHIYLSVYNTSGFISRNQLGHLFDRFYRTDQSRNSGTGGYGLGLSIAAAIVNVHHGKITASTEDEASLLITVVFPV